MQPPATPPPMPLMLLAGLGVVFWLTVAAWSILIGRLSRREPILPVRPRRPVPWSGFDLLLIFFVAVLVPTAVVVSGKAILGPEALKPSPSAGTQEQGTEHSILKLLDKGDWGLGLLALIAAAVVAPIAEEILFRLFLQGWLESVDRRLRRRTPTLRRWLPWSVAPITLVSLFFAMRHFRTQGPTPSTESLGLGMAATILGGLVTVVFGLTWIALVRHATAADFGWVKAKLGEDARIGLLAGAAVAGPLIVANVCLTAVLPKAFAADPIVLFPFAILLGTLYCRTHRILPSIIAHATLNTTSLVLFWLGRIGA